MLKMYLSRAQAEHATLESFRRFLLVTLIFFLLLYTRVSPQQFIFIIVFVLFILSSLDLLKNLLIQLFRTTINPIKWKFSLQKKIIHHLYFPWISKFRNINVFYTPENNEYIEFVIFYTFHRIWKNHIDEDRELFNELIFKLDTVSTKSQKPLTELKINLFVRKAILYYTIPLVIIFVLILITVPSLYQYLLVQNIQIVSVFLAYIVSIWIISNILFTKTKKHLLNSKQKSNETT